MLVPDGGGYAWRWRVDDPDAVTHRIACSAADLLTSPMLRRVHVCPGENCAWLFLDVSRSGRRVWCSEETCGTRNRVRRWRREKHDLRGPTVTSVNMVEIRVAAEAAKSLAASVDSGQVSARRAAVVDGTPDCASVRGTAVKPCAFGAPLRGCGA
jgi:hypothetical protein